MMNRKEVFEAIHKGEMDKLTQYIEAGGSMDIRYSNENKDLFGLTPLHYAVYRGRFDILQLLLAAGVPPNVWDTNSERKIKQCTPLHWVFIQPNKPIQLLMARELIMHGAEIDAVCNHPDYEGQVPLQMAATECGSDVVRLLITAGADINQLDPGGWTPLHFACFHHNTDAVRALIAAGANINITDANNKTAMEIAKSETISLLFSVKQA